MDWQALFLLAEDAQQSSSGATGGASVISILSIIALWFVFKKADEKGWKAIIPLYSTYVLYKLIWGNGWKFLLLLIPIYNIIFYIQSMLRLSRAFGKGTGFGIGLILVNVVFMCMLGFGDAQYQGVQA